MADSRERQQRAQQDCLASRRAPQSPSANFENSHDQSFAIQSAPTLIPRSRGESRPGQHSNRPLSVMPARACQATMAVGGRGYKADTSARFWISLDKQYVTCGRFQGALREDCNCGLRGRDLPPSRCAAQAATPVAMPCSAGRAEHHVLWWAAKKGPEQGRFFVEGAH